MDEFREIWWRGIELTFDKKSVHCSKRVFYNMAIQKRYALLFCI